MGTYGTLGAKKGKCWGQAVRLGFPQDGVHVKKFPEYDLYTQMYDSDFLTQNVLSVNEYCIDKRVYPYFNWKDKAVCKHEIEKSCPMNFEYNAWSEGKRGHVNVC